MKKKAYQQDDGDARSLKWYLNDSSRPQVALGCRLVFDIISEFPFIDYLQRAPKSENPARGVSCFASAFSRYRTGCPYT